ncbi:MAG: autotransporter-associated beta strand repeat-containing protein [Betaproteobacteria bacterium]
MRRSFVACVGVVILAIAPDAIAATRTWSGTLGTGWNTAGNWVEGIVPANGDDLVFPANPTDRDSSNDIAGLSIASVSVTTTNSGADYNFTGNGITLGGAFTFANPGAGATANPHWAIPLTLSAGITMTSSGRISFVEGAIALGANTLALQVDGDLWISGAIAGAGGLTKNGSSALTLDGASGYGGATQVNAGMLRTGSAGALGGSGTGTTFASATTLGLAFGPYAMPEPITFSGPAGTILMIANNQLSGPLAFNGTLAFQMDSPGSLSGPIASNGTIVITDGALSTSGDSPAFTGTVDIQSGGFIPQGTFPAAINLQAPGGLFGTATSGPLTMTGGTFAPGIVLQLFAPAGLASSGGMHNLVMAPGLPVTNYDQIQVAGTVSLGGTTLNTTAAGVLPLGLTFVIIDNDGADPVAGTYAGKAEGTTYLQAGNWFTITYQGGDGNDVVLTTVAAPAGPPSVPVPGPGLPALLLAVAAIAALAFRRARRQLA